jgi:hypothetical protein
MRSHPSPSSWSTYLVTVDETWDCLIFLPVGGWTVPDILNCPTWPVKRSGPLSFFSSAAVGGSTFPLTGSVPHRPTIVIVGKALDGFAIPCRRNSQRGCSP